ncbi:hypothetical protein FOA52_000064 [Chlamydomonas sp. UWO 241]|nr:hypothetical protein FOA52_000064 [Chlamydomonas sp. UWO 241]
MIHRGLRRAAPATTVSVCARVTSRLTVRAQQQEAAPQKQPGQQVETASGPAGAAAPPQQQRPPGARPMPPRMPTGTIMGPDGKPLKVVPVQTTSKDAWEGVAAIDKGEGPTSLGKAALLVAGDTAALLLFAAAGRASHGGGEAVGLDAVVTALPFIVGWFASASLLDGFGEAAQGGDVKAAAGTAAKVWGVGVPLGLVLRGLSKGVVPPTSFIAVTMGVTALLLIGWRTGLAAASKKAPKDAAAQMAARKDKNGNPLEFLQLLFSLTKRW